MTTSFLITFVTGASLCMPFKTTSNNRKEVTLPVVNTVPSKGWVKLFDGRSTKGWHTYGKAKAGSGWVVADEALHLSAANNDKEERGDLVTDQEYENYHLKLEWKVAEGSNSGIIFNVKEDAKLYPSTYNTGPEMQVIDNDGHADGKIIKHRAGDLYDLISCSKEVTKTVGSWNQAEIIVNKGKLDLVLNGVNVVSTTMFDEHWKELIAGSKFNSMAGFGTFKKGKIALQDHGDEVWYRNIMIKTL